MKLSTHRIPGLILTDHEFSLPLDYAHPDGQKISIFAREVVTPHNEDSSLPWLVFFQGGPGFSAPRPDSDSGWLKRALKDYRVLLLDQRGTGRSTPVTFQSLARLASAQAQADHVMLFRSDNIVRDAEQIRQQLVGKEARWSVLGQSFGGFCVTRYLSAAPEGLSEAILTGGLPPLNRHADDIYRATYRRVLQKNQAYFERYPEDAALTRRIADVLDGHDARLPGGGALSVRRFQQLGIGFGASGGFERVHYLLENAFAPGATAGELSYTFLRGIEDSFSFETNPIYALLHEAEYCQDEPSNWSAERIRTEFPQFDAGGASPFLFTGEMVYPWMFDEYEYLKPLKDAAELLARYDKWPRLYDVEALRANTIPCAAAVYYNDMYVERAFSEETAGQIRGMKVWLTNEYEHNALRADGARLLDRLLGMLHGEV